MGCIHSTYTFKRTSRKNNELDESRYNGSPRGVENHDINIEWKGNLWMTQCSQASAGIGSVCIEQHDYKAYN